MNGIEYWIYFTSTRHELSYYDHRVCQVLKNPTRFHQKIVGTNLLLIYFCIHLRKKKPDNLISWIAYYKLNPNLAGSIFMFKALTVIGWMDGWMLIELLDTTKRKC